MVGDPVMAWRAQGIAAARGGDRAAARAMLDQALRLDTQDADSWFWLAAVQPDPYQARALLIQVLVLDPYHARARAGLAAVEAQLAPPGVPLPAPAILAPPAHTEAAVARPGAAASAGAAIPAFPRPPAPDQRAGRPPSRPARPPAGMSHGRLLRFLDVLGLGDGLIKALFVGGVMVAVLVACAGFQGFSSGRLAGAAAPDFAATDIATGHPVTLAGLRGHPVWLSFWATWCPPCRAEMPEMQARYARWRGQGLVMLSVDASDSRDTMQQFVRRNGYTWTFLADFGAASGLYGVNAIPTHIFLDRSGVVQATDVGGLTSATMDAALAKIIGP